MDEFKSDMVVVPIYINITISKEAYIEIPRENMKYLGRDEDDGPIIEYDIDKTDLREYAKDQLNIGDKIEDFDVEDIEVMID